jgi:hypothetical protein
MFEEAVSISLIATTQLFERSIQEAEQGQRGFVITGDNAYLDIYRMGAQNAYPGAPGTSTHANSFSLKCDASVTTLKTITHWVRKLSLSTRTRRRW